MSVLFRRQMDKLKQSMLNLSALVEANFQEAIDAVRQRDAKKGQRVIDRDRDIDLKEVDIEEECLATLALYQPVAHDLRFVVAVLKMNNDLERIGDLAANIAGQAIEMSKTEPVGEDACGLYQMASKAQMMLKRSLDALVNLDADLAAEVRRMDDDVDALHGTMYDRVEQQMRQQPDLLAQYIRLLSCGRQVERIADHATNIAKDVIYLVRGEIIRHAKKRGLKV